MVEAIAKISWTDPETNEQREVVLTEGVSLEIGRGQENEIYIPEKTVSRKHAVIRYESGLFVIEDLGSANKTFVNDEMITFPYPLMAGDLIRLYKPEIRFQAIVNQAEIDAADRTGTLLRAKVGQGRAKLVITGGTQEGMEIPLMQERITFGRATANATWDIKLSDHAVSRPHAEIVLKNNVWHMVDLDSANHTFVNGNMISTPTPMRDGSVILMGETTMLFKEG